MRNPCLKCKRHLKGLDKNGPECTECLLRLQYAHSIEVKDEDETLQVRNWRKCKVCGTEKILEEEYNRKGRKKGEYVDTCKECMGESIMRAREEKAVAKVTIMIKDKGLHTWLKERAGKEFRTVENQILFFLTMVKDLENTTVIEKKTLFEDGRKPQPVYRSFDEIGKIDKEE